MRGACGSTLSPGVVGESTPCAFGQGSYSINDSLPVMGRRHLLPDRCELVQ